MALIDMPDGTVFDTETGDRYTDRDAADRWAKGGGGGGGDIQPPPGYDTWEQWQQGQGTFPGKGVFPPGTQPPDWSQPPPDWKPPTPPPYGFASWSAYYAAQQQQGGGGVQPGATPGITPPIVSGLPGVDTKVSQDLLAAYLNALGLAGKEYRNPWEAYRASLFPGVEALYDLPTGMPDVFAAPGSDFPAWFGGVSGNLYSAAADALRKIFGSAGVSRERGTEYFNPYKGEGADDLSDLLRLALITRYGVKGADYWAKKLKPTGTIGMGYRAQQEAQPEQSLSYLDWAIGKLPGSFGF